ncbi:MAG TPA: aldo/keto reductase [Acidimicrobiia bacterium]|jgi:diketogulonate reductase-like aldo/keto reductase|nr:aldo/keto reductase [Acidimicrobiia bacterium]
MTLQLDSTVTLNDGIEMPRLGLGVFKSEPGAETENAVRWAIEAGYRHIDTASLYANEASVGAGIRASELPRSEVFVTTKVWNTDQGYDATLRAFDRSLVELGFDYVDLYLVHWPVPARGLAGETWRALEAIKAEGRSRSIGVSNFEPHHLDQLAETSEVVPSVNQVELHPYLQQQHLQEYCAEHGIRLEAWSPLAKGAVVDDAMLTRIGNRHGKTPVQVTVRWMLQKGIVTIPKSVKQQRIVANADVFDFELSPDEMAEIETLDRDGRTGPHPDTF